MRVVYGVAGVLIAAAAWGDEIKPQQFPPGWNCASVPATERSTCEKTQIQAPKLEDPPSPPASGEPQPIYPNGKLPPPAKPPSSKLSLPPPGNGT